MPAAVPFTLAVITDEIAPDLETALPIAAELGLHVVELNQVGEKNVADLTREEQARARELLEAAGMRVVAVGPPCFKACVLDEVAVDGVGADPVFREHLATLRRAVTAAHAFGAAFVRVFSFRRAGMVGLGNPSPRLPEGGPIPEAMLDRIAAGLRLACEVAEEGDVTLVLENVRSCWGNSGVNARRILDAAGSPRLRALWDPGNDYVSGGVPYPDGYEAVRPYLAHVHLKDARVLDPATGRTAWEAVGAGEAEAGTQLRALSRDGYTGVVSLETHWRAPGQDAVRSTRRSMEGLRRLLEAMG
jgi:sugar phosphate isomerase/epimerase